MPSKNIAQLDYENEDNLNANSVKSPAKMVKSPSKIKEETIDSGDESPYDDDDDDGNSKGDRSLEDQELLTNLPLEVITTIEPYNIQYPNLKNMSNGVLTHRNIFTEQEREVLRKIVEKYRTIVDTRRRTRETYLEKQSVWQQIVEEFNGSENVMMRTEKELKKCWDNMKYRARLAEKEQQRADSNGNVKNLLDQQLPNSAIHATLEQMLALQPLSTVEEQSGVGLNETEIQLDETHTKDWSNHSVKGDELDESGDDEDQDSYIEDEQPLLKKARQESPKLSSILLGEAKKSSSKNEINMYNIPNCTKVTHFKKRLKKCGSHPVSILPKGLNSCVSIRNIPNPNQLEATLNSSDFSSTYGPINLGGGVTISPQKSCLPPSINDGSYLTQVKPMPTLRKMLSPKCNSSKGLKNDLSKSSACFGDHLSSSVNTENLEEQILLQRLEFENQEHSLKMKILEKQLFAYTNEAQYWEFKLKLLRTGQEDVIGKLVNGSV